MGARWHWSARVAHAVLRFVRRHQEVLVVLGSLISIAAAGFSLFEAVLKFFG
jgi:hypothetical protein